MARRQDPTPEQHKQLLELVESGAGILTIAKQLDIGRGTARRWRDVACAEIGTCPNQSTLTKSDQNTLDQIIIQKSRELLRERGRKAKRQTKRVQEIEFDLEGPIGIAFFADIHIGSSEVDYDQLEQDTETVLNTEGMYCMHGGDGCDNHIKHISAMLAQNMPIGEQWQWHNDWLADLAESGKIKAIVGGNHDAWTYIVAGIDVLKQQAALHDIPHAENELLMDVKVGEQIYKMLMRHKYRFNSSLNAGHSVKRMYDMQRHFDVGVVCDKHEFTVEPFVRDAEVRWAARPGSYQITSGFAASKGYPNAQARMPVAIFWPDRKKAVCQFDLEDGVLYLEAARRAWFANGKRSTLSMHGSN